MNSISPYKFAFFDKPSAFYDAMIDDIKGAQKYIFIETYKFGNDQIGKRFRDVLTSKAREGVEVKLLIDSWGAAVGEEFFIELINYGGEVTFFEKLKISLDIFSKNHRRNHRKLLIIDDIITYIGSANISFHSFNWRESVLRLEHKIAQNFKRIFLEDFVISKKLYPNKKKFTKTIYVEDFEIIKDIPSNFFQPTRKIFLKLIKNAKEELIIETPYFLPGSIVRKAIVKAAKRGVKVSLVTPLHSDVGLFDILRNKYLGYLCKRNISIYLYKPNNLHAKVMIVDKEIFIVGSSNFDYRSFRFMHEINLLGKKKDIIEEILKHIEESKFSSILFDYEKWLKRPWILKTIEWLLVPVRHFF